MTAQGSATRLSLERGLYAITDGPRSDLVAACEAALAGGAVALQYRDKTGDATRRGEECRALILLCRRVNAALIVNDDVALAAASGANGVHLGEGDANIADARAVLGPTAIIGASCYDDLARARALAAAGADYLAFGAFFPSPTKPNARHATPDILRRTAQFGLPRVAIGGITPDHGRALVAAGVDNLAVISGVFGAHDIRAAARQYANLFATDLHG